MQRRHVAGRNALNLTDNLSFIDGEGTGYCGVILTSTSKVVGRSEQTADRRGISSIFICCTFIEI
jgi:hypothetical protein